MPATIHSRHTEQNRNMALIGTVAGVGLTGLLIAAHAASALIITVVALTALAALKACHYQYQLLRENGFSTLGRTRAEPLPAQAVSAQAASNYLSKIREDGGQVEVNQGSRVTQEISLRDDAPKSSIPDNNNQQRENSSSSALVSYDSQALAAGVLHEDMAVRGREQLQKAKLPPNTTVFIHFSVTADLNQSNLEQQVHHAATVCLQTSSADKLTITAVTGAHVSTTDRGKSGFQLQSISRRESVRSSNTSVVPNNSSKECVVFRHALITSEHATALNSMDARKRCPFALAITQAVSEIFKNGVPLPSSQSFHYCTFKVLVCTPHSHKQQSFLSQSLSRLRFSNSDNTALNVQNQNNKRPAMQVEFIQTSTGNRGTLDGREVTGGGWSSTGVQSAIHDGSTNNETLANEYLTLSREVEGQKSPEVLPSTTRAIMPPPTGVTIEEVD